MSDLKDRSFQAVITVECCGCCHNSHEIDLSGRIEVQDSKHKIVISAFVCDEYENTPFERANGIGCKVDIPVDSKGVDLVIEF